MELDRNSSLSGMLGIVSDHRNDTVDVVCKDATTACDFAAHTGSCEGDANAFLKALDTVLQHWLMAFNVHMFRKINYVSPAKWSFIVFRKRRGRKMTASWKLSARV